MEAKKETGEEKLKVKTDEEKAKELIRDEKAFLNEPEPFKVGEKIIWIKELKIKDRPKLDKLFIVILKKMIGFLSSVKDPVELMSVIEKDLATANRDDIDFIMAGVLPCNPDFKAEELDELTKTEMTELQNLIQKVNGLEISKKVNPLAETDRP